MKFSVLADQRKHPASDQRAEWPDEDPVTPERAERVGIGRDDPSLRRNRAPTRAGRLNQEVHRRLDVPGLGKLHKVGGFQPSETTPGQPETPDQPEHNLCSRILAKDDKAQIGSYLEGSGDLSWAAHEPEREFGSPATEPDPPQAPTDMKGRHRHR